MSAAALEPAPQGEPVRTQLADGRELLYFSDAGAFAAPRLAQTPPADTRRLPPRPDTPRMRYDPLLGEWVSYAAHRQTRTHLPPASECPLCPSSPDHATEIPAPKYDVAVFENRFPAFGPAADAAGAGGSDGAAGTGGETAAAGRCEVVAFASDHQASFAGLSQERVHTVIRAWTHRTAELSRLPGVEQVFIFENRGAEIGVTLHHPHGQIYAYPFATPRTLRQLESVQAYRADSGGDLFGDLLARELREGSRLVARGHWFSAYVPYAARMPLEVHVVPHRHVPDLVALTDAERKELAGLYLDVLRRVEALYKTPTPYIAAWYQAPVDHPGREDYRMHLQVTSPRRAEDKLKYLAGSEAAMGAFIADVSPEETAARLRKALPPFNPGASGAAE